MNFAWVADQWRRRGVMTRRWPQWRKTYGDFTLERPLSAPMKAFVAKAGVVSRRPDSNLPVGRGRCALIELGK
jgi:hypothetical protein